MDRCLTPMLYLYKLSHKLNFYKFFLSVDFGIDTKLNFSFDYATTSVLDGVSKFDILS